LASASSSPGIEALSNDGYCSTFDELLSVEEMNYFSVIFDYPAFTTVV
jgi:hypothetical protein